MTFKRPLECGGGGSVSPRRPPALRRCRSLDLEIRGCRHLEELIARCVQKLEGAVESAISKLRYETQHLSLQDLKDITKNFSDERILGSGGSGMVYKGVLQNGKMIAVKKVESMLGSKEQCERAKKQFENEVNLLMRLKHPNIVQLLGHCYETHHIRWLHDGKYIICWQIDSLLCLEFLPESLNGRISDATSGLDWHTRYKIIEGISYGLKYLHEQSDAPIIHLDLKPANILLDANMLPKIADFGISRVFDRGQTIYTKTTSGTLGYMPPEFLRGIITPMSDIFSLGVIIMEVIMGHRDYPYDLKASSEEFINKVWHLALSYLRSWRIPFKQQVWTKVDQFVGLLTQKLSQPLELKPD